LKTIVTGEGVVVAAQCTPGQLTQYQIEKPDGDHFWAHRDELNTPWRERVGLGPHQRFRLVGIGLSTFREREDAAAQPGSATFT
jgi:hypothetical protein